MRAFWTGWGLAVLLLSAGTFGAVWMFGASRSWPVVPHVLTNVVGIALLLLMVIGAFRSALLGTMALKQLLAENLAIVIAMELDDLRRAAEQRALSLQGEATPASTAQGMAALGIPKFFGERDEIRKLLGAATAHTLQEIHVSLQTYNEAARAGALAGLGGKAALIQERVSEAARLLNQFLPRGSAA
jgi:hypothetical protein